MIEKQVKAISTMNRKKFIRKMQIPFSDRVIQRFNQNFKI